MISKDNCILLLLIALFISILGNVFQHSGMSAEFVEHPMLATIDTSNVEFIDDTVQARDSIVIVEKTVERKSYYKTDTTYNDYVKNDTVVIDINTATAKEFEKLPYVGKVLGERIVKFRTSLHHFYHIDQVKEVYGIGEDSFEAMRPYLTINKPVLPCLNLYDEEGAFLYKHPYIRKYSDCVSETRDSLDIDSFDQFVSKCKVDDVDKIQPYLIVVHSY